MAERVSKAERAYSRKVKDAVHLLFFTHHRLPGHRKFLYRADPNYYAASLPKSPTG